MILTHGSNCKTFLARDLASSDCVKIIFGRVFSIIDGKIVMLLMTVTDLQDIMTRCTRISESIIFKKQVADSCDETFLEFAGRYQGWKFF